MSTSDMSKAKGAHPNLVVVYLAVAAACIAVNLIYARFSHDVSSAAMTWMFLYPFLGGSGFLALLHKLFPEFFSWRGYRVFFNLHNSAHRCSHYTRRIREIGRILAAGMILITLYLSENCRDR